jgi:hypothetical protein
LVDPFSSITSALSKTGKYTLNTFQINFIPIKDSVWKEKSLETIKVLESKYPAKLKNFILSKYFIIIKILFFPITALLWITKQLWKVQDDTSSSAEETNSSTEETSSNKNILDKLSLSGYNVSINIIQASDDPVEGRATIKEIYSTL